MVSKAFTKESDDAPAEPVVRLGVPVPDGHPNYLTAGGARALRAELDALGQRTRDADDEARFHELTDHLASAEIVEAPADPDRVGFGAHVVVEDEAGKPTAYQIVGAIEASPRDGAIGWQSPLARALFGARVGDSITLPRGGDVEITSITYAN